MAKWDAALRTVKLLRPDSLTSIWTPTSLKGGGTYGYGFGWFTGTIHGRRVVFHGGAWQGFKSFIVRFLDDNLSIIFFANSFQT